MAAGTSWVDWASGYAGLSDTVTCTTNSYMPGYNGYTNLQMAQLPQYQASHSYQYRHAGCPSPLSPYERALRAKLESEARSALIPQQGPPNDPFWELCNHQFHGLLDEFVRLKERKK